MPRVPMVALGDTGLKVSRLGFGTFDLGSPSLNISPEEGGRILAESYKLGVNFWDTSDDYGSHPHVASALKRVTRKDVVISTKTGAKTVEEAIRSLRSALRELSTDYIDIFLMHCVESDWIGECHRVLRELNDVRTTGIVKAVGLSTHSVTVVKEASQFEELDVIMTVLCKADQAVISQFPEKIPLEDGTIEEMFSATELAHNSGKGTIAMKVLGSAAPPVVNNYGSSIKAIAQLDFVDTMVIGMRNLGQVKKSTKAILSAHNP